MQKFNSTFWLIGVLILHFYGHCNAAMTIEQLKKTAMMMRSVCVPKFKISEELADAVSKGDYPDDKNTKCYINCLLENTQALKKGKVNYENAIKQIDLMLPDDMKGPWKAGLEACKDSTVGIKNHCQAAFVAANCLKENNPLFQLP